MRQLCYEDVSVGDQVGSQVVEVDERQLFFYSAAAYMGHRLHYDLNYTRDVEGYPNLLVQGALQSSLMAKTVTDWIGPMGRLVRFSFQNRASAFLGDELRFVGRVVAKRDADGEALVDLIIQEERGEGEILMPGSATVALPKRIGPDESVHKRQ